MSYMSLCDVDEDGGGGRAAPILHWQAAFEGTRAGQYCRSPLFVTYGGKGNQRLKILRRIVPPIVNS